MIKLKAPLFAASLVAVLALASTQSSFGQELITNGNFTGLSSAAGGELGYNVNMTGWSSTGYNFVFPSGNPGDTNVTGASGQLSVYGPANGSANGLVLPPGGGNVVACDGAFQVGPLSQAVTGLTAGKVYAVSFNWAGAQQSGFAGGTTESWSVALGGTGFTAGSGDTSGTLAGSQTTTVVNNVNKGFTGWMSQTFDFTATTSSETLYFLANGTPTGQPPFALLGNVSLTAVPEASSYWTVAFAMGIMFGTAFYRRFHKSAAVKV